ncbi:MFS general substrate transporter [Paxillus ammoniavirescens]|nr:MFS general substrate transporter [Paxillus ammoniavirescens]
MSTTPKNEKPGEEEKPGASWNQKEEHVLPKNRLGIVLFALMCTTFLTALDQMIVAVALPTIVTDVGGGDSYSWVGSAYMLAAATFGPLYGKLSNMFGRKPILYSSIIIFLVGSALCGAAQSMNWLIICRAIQGTGGGGIIQLVIITISDIVPLQDRGRYGGIVGATYGFASMVGPLLGGVLAEHVSWRWCFFINLPTGGLAAVLLFIFLNLNPHQKRPLRDQVAELDFIGLFSLVTGVICLLIGFDFSQTSWSDARTIALLVVGLVLLIIGGINEIFTTRAAILPARLFKTRTTGIILITVFLHGIVFFAATYSHFLVLGASATGAGVRMIPFQLGGSIASITSGITLSKIGKYRVILWTSYVLMTLGMGLMITLDYTSRDAEKEIFPLITSLGIGCLFQTPLIALQAAMPLKDMATASSAYMFLRTVGGAVGIAVGEAIISTVLPKKLSVIAGISSLGLVCTPLCGVALILTLFLRAYSLSRKTMQSGDAKTVDDAEKGTEAPSYKDEDGTEITRTNTIAAVGGSDKDKETLQM